MSRAFFARESRQYASWALGGLGCVLGGGAVSVCKCESKPRISAIRHAESVANVRKKADELAYSRRAWLDDSEKPQHERLRDCVLSDKGVESTLACADEMEQLDHGDGDILLVVSPMTRTILTASLLFFKLNAGRTVKVVIEPLVQEVINSPHDIVEDVGRPMDEVFSEAAQVLMDHNADGAIDMLGKLQEASKGLDRLWWFKPYGPDNLPRNVLRSGMDERRALMKDAVQRHVKQQGNISRVFIIGHWGVLYTLSGRPGARNLECIDLEDF